MDDMFNFGSEEDARNEKGGNEGSGEDGDEGSNEGDKGSDEDNEF